MIEKEKGMINFIKKNKKWAISLSLVTLMLLVSLDCQCSGIPQRETIPADQTIDDDTFISGQNVVVDGTVNGILLATGNTVTINGTVNGDAFLAGETIVVSKGAVINGNLFVGSAEITVDGTVTGSMFGGSAALKTNGNIGRNLFYGGFSLTAGENSSIARDLYVGSYQSLLYGTVGRNLKADSAAFVLNGSIAGDATINVGDVDQSTNTTQTMSYNPWISRYVEEVHEPGISISDKASIGGKVTYTSSIDDSNELEEIAGGTVIYQTPVPPTEGETPQRIEQVKPFHRGTPMSFGWNTGLNVVRSFIRLFVLGALALWLLQKPFKKIVNAAYEQPFKAMGWGFVIVAVGILAAIIVPLVFIMIGVLIGLVSLGSLLFFWFGLIGITLLLAITVFFFAAFTLSKLIAAYMLGKWLMVALFRQSEEKVWLNLLVGVFLFVLIQAIRCSAGWPVWPPL
jgi:cytoskeletal protein CcmA (bactofilin family)